MYIYQYLSDSYTLNAQTDWTRIKNGVLRKYSPPLNLELEMKWTGLWIGIILYVVNLHNIARNIKLVENQYGLQDYLPNKQTNKK